MDTTAVSVKRDVQHSRIHYIERGYAANLCLILMALVPGKLVYFQSQPRFEPQHEKGPISNENVLSPNYTRASLSGWMTTFR